MSVDATPIQPPSSATDPSYFGLRTSRFHSSETPSSGTLRSPLSSISPSHIETPLPPSESSAANAPQSAFKLPPTTGSRSSSYENAKQSIKRRIPPAHEFGHSSIEGKGPIPWKVPFKLPRSLSQDKVRQGSESSSGGSTYRKESGTFSRTRRGRSSTGISPGSTEAGGLATKIPARLIEPLLPPITRQLTQSVPYQRKITIETDFEDSEPKPQPALDIGEGLTKPIPKKGLFAKSKRYIKLLAPLNQKSHHNDSARLERVGSNGKRNGLESILRPVALTRWVSPETYSISSKESKYDARDSEGSKDSRRSHGFFSRGVWKRHRGISNSSSIQASTQSAGHSITLEESSKCLEPDQRQHFNLDISNPRCANFLASEAQRIGTPPVPGGEHEDWNFHKRGFFYDYNALPEAGMGERDAPDPAEAIRKGPEDAFNPRPKRRERNPSETGWFSLQMHLMDKQVEAERRNAEIQESDVPEHLPSSPLCPRNAKHTSGGKGTCIYHGRNRSSSAKAVAEDLIPAAALGGVY